MLLRVCVPVECVRMRAHVEQGRTEQQESRGGKEDLGCDGSCIGHEDAKRDSLVVARVN